MPLFKRKRFDSAPIFTVGDDSFIVKRAEAGSTGALLDIQDETGASLFTVGNDGVVGPITVTTGSIELGTGTTGDYVEALNAGTGVSITNNSGEGAIPTVAIGQSVGTSDSVTFGSASITNQLSLSTALSTGSVDFDIQYPPSTGESTSYAQTNSAITLQSNATEGQTTIELSNGEALIVGVHAEVAIPNNNGVIVGNHGDTHVALTVGGGGSLAPQPNLQEWKSEYLSFDPAANTVAYLTNAGRLYTDNGIQTLQDVYATAVSTDHINGYVIRDATNGPYALALRIDGNLNGLEVINFPATSGTVALESYVDGEISNLVGNIALGTDTTGDYVSSLVAGTGITITNNSGENATPTIEIGQAVGTTDDVEFHDVTVTGDLTVTGTLNTVNETNLAIEDAFIYLNDGSTISNPDLGIAGNYNDGSYKHAGIFRDATDGTWKFFQGYTEEPGADINVAHASYADAPVKALSATLTQSTGTAPLTVSSTTKVSNLNADLLDDQEGSWYSPPGMITMYGGSSAPSGWIICDGSAVSRTTYSSLYAVIGTTYGSGDGSTTFNVPNLNGRVAVGFNSSDTSFDTLGEVGGHKETQSHTHDGASHTHTGTTATEGAHTHTYSDYSQDGGAAVNFGTQYTVGGPVVTTRTTSAGSAHSHTFTTSAPAAVGTTGSYGGGNAGNLQPYIVLNYIIKI